MSRERGACPRPFGTWNVVGGTSSVRYEDTRKDNLCSSVWYEESSRLDYVRQVQSRAKGELVIVHPVRGINQAGLRPSGMKSGIGEFVLVRPA